MKLFFRKKKTVPSAQGEQAPQAPLSVFPYRGSFPAGDLPAGCEILLSPEPGADPNLHFIGEDGIPSGRYFLFCGPYLPAEGRRQLFEVAIEQSAALVLFCEKQVTLPQSPAGRDALCRPEKFGFFLSAKIGTFLLSEMHLPREYVSAFALALCDDVALLSSGKFQSNPRPATKNTRDPRQDAIDATDAFNAVKTQLTAPAYKFLFDKVAAGLVSAYAYVALHGTRDELCAFDENAKSLNMALRVAAYERAPLHFLHSLEKHKFVATLPIRLAAKLALQHKN